MNLFLLTAVPLAAVAAHRFLFPSRAPFRDPRSWILGTVFSLGSLILASFFGQWREFTGNGLTVFLGLIWTDVVLVPGLVVTAWFLMKRSEVWELGLWLAIAFTLAGIRDFANTTPVFDLNEYFLVPLHRILMILVLPTLVTKAFREALPLQRGLAWALAAGSAVTGPLFQILSFLGWGWIVWVLVLAGIAGALWWLHSLESQPAEASPPVQGS